MKKISKEELHSIFIEMKNNNELAFNNLYEKYSKLVYAISFSILKNRENSEDIVQKVFTKLWRIEKDKLPTNNEASWLYSMTKNETLNFLRNQKEEHDIDEIYYIVNEDKELNEIIEKDTYNRIISRLNKEEQEIISLKILSNLSFKEISQILNKPIGTVQWKYYKSLHTLKILLSSLSMYIVTMLAFITQKTKSKNVTEPERENITIQEDSTEKREESTIKKEENNPENSKTESSDINIDTELTTVVEQKYNTNLNSLDIGLLSISSIFLVITIIFLIFFIKSQQKAKKKVSK